MDFNPAPAGGPDGALAWYNQSLAKVLGLNPANPALPADLLSELVTDVQRQAVAAVIDKRFRRHVDPETGAVTIDQVGDPLVLAEPDAEQDPVVANLAASYLGAAQAAIAAVDANQCIPGTCPDQIAGTIDQIRSTIDLVKAEAPDRRRIFQMYLHLNELTDDYSGLVPKLIKLFAGSRNQASVDTLARERAISSLRVAKRAIGSFEDAIREIRAGEDEPSLSEQGEIVRNCASHVGTHVAQVRAAFMAAGVGECEIRSVELSIGEAVQLSSECFETVSLDQALHMLQTESARWPSLIASGQRAGFVTLAQSAQMMRPIVAALDSEAILVSLGILPDAERPSESRETLAMGLAFRIDRLRGYALSVLDTILREGPVLGRPLPRRRYRPKTPGPDAAPLK